MDWDDVRAKPKAAGTVGEDLTALSIGDLEERIAALKAEIARIEATVAAKRRQQAAAASVFKS